MMWWWIIFTEYGDDDYYDYGDDDDGDDDDDDDTDLSASCFPSAAETTRFLAKSALLATKIAGLVVVMLMFTVMVMSIFPMLITCLPAFPSVWGS